MTFATKITIVRILLVPVFVLCVLYYSEGYKDGQPDERWRIAAAIVFAAASVSDWIDGWIARRFNQKSRLGATLDPLADKGLMLSALLTLSFVAWPTRLPLWFPVLIISRDLLSIAGAFLINNQSGKVEIRPHWTGKTATFLQMTTICWVLFTLPHALPWMIASAVFTVLSGALYIRDGLGQLHDSDEHPPSAA
jgi:CDP-diacylglycerol--glycerol-3-phosphate 3-phosphatidyltransferase/cardiolipin synthase